MQIFVRDGRHVAVEAEVDSTVADVKAAYLQKACGGLSIHNEIVLLHNSKQLRDEATLGEAGVTSGATLSVTSRLRGGGGDGGSTGAESRSCYLEMYAEKKPDKVNPAEEMLARATRCRLSGERLQPPCVADELGSLFNKEALVHALLNKTLPPALAYISSLKAVTTLKLDPINRASTHAAAGPGPGSSNGNSNGRGSSCDLAVFQCPVTGLEMNGRYPFVIHKPSGVVLSERALREVPVAAEELLGGKWSKDDLIPVNPQGEELEKRKEAVAAAMAAERLRKAAKKAEKAASKAASKAAAAGGSEPAGATAADAAAAALAGSKRGLPPAGPAAPGAPAAAAANGGNAQKKLKLPAGATPEVYASIFSSGQTKVKETFCCRSASGRGLGAA